MNWIELVGFKDGHIGVAVPAFADDLLEFS